MKKLEKIFFAGFLLTDLQNITLVNRSYGDPNSCLLEGKSNNFLLKCVGLINFGNKSSFSFYVNDILFCQFVMKQGSGNYVIFYA
jgi:hypothetical protein